MSYVYREWLLAVMSVLGVFQGSGIGGVKVIYLVAAANHWKLLFLCWDHHEGLSLRLLLCLTLATFSAWSFVTMTFIDLFDGAIFGWSEEVFFPFATFLRSVGLLACSHLLMSLGRIWCRKLVL